MYQVLREKNNLFLTNSTSSKYYMFIYRDGVWGIDNESMPINHCELVYVGDNPFSTDEHFFDCPKGFYEPIFKQEQLLPPEEIVVKIYSCDSKFYKYDDGQYWELGRCVYDDDFGDIITLNQVENLPWYRTVVWEGTIDEFDSLKYDSLVANTQKEIKLDNKHKIVVEDGRLYVIASQSTTWNRQRKLCKLSGILAYLLNRHPKLKERAAFKKALFKNNILIKAKTLSGFQVSTEYGRYNMFWNELKLIETLRKYL